MKKVQKSWKQPRFVATCLALGIVAIMAVVAAWRFLAVDGTLRVATNLTRETSVMSLFAPASRIEDPVKNIQSGVVYQRLVGDQATLSVQVPRAFDTVQARVAFWPEGARIVQFGLVVSLSPYSVQWKTAYAAVVQEAIDALWQRVNVNDAAAFLARETRVQSIDDVKERAKADEVIGVLDMPIPRLEYREVGYTPSNSMETIPYQLQGSHQFLTYIKDEALQLSFDVRDTNRTPGPDTARIRIFNEAVQTVFEQAIDDDSTVEANDREEAARRIQVNVPQLPEGVYMIDVQAAQDIVFANIQTGQRRFVANRHVQLFGMQNNETIPQVLTVQARELRVSQTDTQKEVAGAAPYRVRFGSDTIRVVDAKKGVLWQQASQEKPMQRAALTPDMPYLTLDGNGFIAFSDAAFFDVDAGFEEVTTALQLSQVDGLLVSQDLVAAKKGYTKVTNTVAHDIRNVLGDHKDLRFVLYAPNNELLRTHVDVQSVQLDFERHPLWQRLQQRFQ